jgi:hypothetical protein
MARGGLKTPEPGRVTGRVGDGVGESEADGGRRFSTLHCTGMMRSRERGRKRSRVEVRMKSKTRLSGFSREASRHTSGRRRMWSVVCGAPAGGEFGWRWATAGLTQWATLSTAGRADLHLPLPA